MKWFLRGVSDLFLMVGTELQLDEGLLASAFGFCGGTNPAGRDGAGLFHQGRLQAFPGLC